MAKKTHKVVAAPDWAAVGARIRQIRGEARQDDFAPLLGVTQGQLSKVERGVMPPSVEMLWRLRERFGVSVDWVLGGK